MAIVTASCENPTPVAATLVEQRQWFVVYSKPRKEVSAQFHLQRKGIEVFAPKVLLPQSFDRRIRVVQLFPSYLFVRMHPVEDYYTVLWSPGVSRFITSRGGLPAALDDEVVAFLMERTNEHGVIAARPDLKVGQRVEVTRGPFDGLMAIITKPPDAKGRVKVLMQLLNRQPVRVDMPVHSLKAAWTV